MFADKANSFLLVILIAFTILVAMLLAGFAAPLVVGAILASLAYRPYARLAAKFRGQKNLAALVVLLAIILIIILPFLSLITLLGTEAFALFSETRDQLSLNTELAKAITKFSEAFNLEIDVQDFIATQVGPVLKGLGLFLYEEVGGVLSSVIRLLISFFIMLLTVFYLLRDGDKLGAFFLNLKLFRNSDGLHIFQVFKNTGKAIFFGTILAALAQGVLGGFGFFLFGLKSPVLWGAVISFLGLIPLLGAYVVFIPAAIFLFITAPVWQAILFLLYNIVIVSTVDNIIRPKVVGDKINIHPFLIFLAILGGLKLFGLLGIIYGPLIASIFLVLLEMYRDHHHSQAVT